MTTIALACLASGFIGMQSFDAASLLLVITLLVATVIGARANVVLPGNFDVSGSYVPVIAGCVLVPDAAPLIASAVLLAPMPSVGVRALNASIAVICATAGGAAAAAIGGEFGVSTIVAGLTFLVANCLLLMAYECIVWRTPIDSLIAPLLGSLLATSVFALPLIAVVVWLFEAAGTAAVAMLVLPLVVTSYFHSLYQRKVQLTEELAEKAQILARTNLQFAAAMVRALDQRDAYTAGHSAAVAVYTRDIAREMGFDEETIRLAHLAGLLHDIGKIGVPGRVLNKTAPLDDEEYELMKTHAAMGADILGEVDLYADIAVLVRYHYERIDGRGYPQGIGGEAIPAISRMISVADTYSAMTTDRPYRDGMPTEKAMTILRDCRGTQLDQDFTDAFLRILIVADEAYQRGKQTDFEVEVAKHQAMSEVEAESVRLTTPHPASPEVPAQPLLPAAVDGEQIEVELEREAA